jgi:acyl dehydratase
MRYFEDIEPGQKERFGSYRVTKEEIVAFAGQYDPQPFHLDEEAAKRSLFGGICASGWHTAAMTMRLVVDDFTSKGVASLGSPGGEHLRWRRPVYPGDTLSVEIEILEKKDHPKRPNVGLVKTSWTTFNQKNEPVMTLIAEMLMAKRPQEG